MGLIRFVQAHNRNKELKEMIKLKEQELAVIENKEISDVREEIKNDEYEVLRMRFAKGEITEEEYDKMKKILEDWKGGLM